VIIMLVVLEHVSTEKYNAENITDLMEICRKPMEEELARLKCFPE
jgi:hypothetical protein